MNMGFILFLVIALASVATAFSAFRICKKLDASDEKLERMALWLCACEEQLRKLNGNPPPEK